jgi:hypothetical protein
MFGHLADSPHQPPQVDQAGTLCDDRGGARFAAARDERPE